MRSFFLRGDIFSLFFQLFQFDQITVSKKRAIVERLKEEWMYVMYGPSAEKKKQKWPV